LNLSFGAYNPSRVFASGGNFVGPAAGEPPWTVTVQ
jgi:hypothetical protein